MVVLFLVAALPGHALIDQDDAVAVWLMDDDDATAADLTGNGFDGELIAGADWTDGVFGGAVDLPGGGDVVRIDDMGLTMPTDNITFVCWVNVQGVKNQDLFSFEPLEIAGGRATAHLPWDNGIHWQFGTPFTGINPVAWDEDKYVDAWTHWAFTSSSDDGNLLVYEDGVEVRNVGGARELQNGAAAFQIGGRTGSSLEGWIDEFAIFSTVLSEADIVRIMDQGLARALAFEAVEPRGKAATTWAAIRTKK
jgi:hypothetical protein